MSESIINTRHTNINIRELQSMLMGLSHMIPTLPSVAVSGIWNEQTENAVRAFQEYEDMPVTGTVDLATWVAIVTAYEGRSEPFSPGAPLFPLFNPQLASHPETIPHFVEMLQVLLRTLDGIPGFYPVPAVTGVYDDLTAAAVTSVQMLSGLKCTGTCDLAVWNAAVGMYNQEMRKLQSSPPVKQPN